MEDRLTMKGKARFVKKAQLNYLCLNRTIGTLLTAIRGKVIKRLKKNKYSLSNTISLIFSSSERQKIICTS